MKITKWLKKNGTFKFDLPQLSGHHWPQQVGFQQAHGAFH